MYNISLICTVHNEFGNCNSNELYNIIEKANPEIIFEEFDISRTDDEYYKNGHYKNQDVCSVETTAIMKYLERHQIVHIPVDMYDISDIHKRDVDYMYTKISNHSEEYINLLKMQLYLLSQQGFSFINSIEHSNLLEKLHMLEEKVVKILNDERLSNIYEMWQLVTNNRDNEIVKNIYNYSKNHYYNNAIFIIGAEHKKSIIEKIKNYEIENKFKLNWSFNIFNKIVDT